MVDPDNDHDAVIMAVVFSLIVLFLLTGGFLF